MGELNWENKKKLFKTEELFFAVWTGLEPATPCVTGRYSNQLNYQTVAVMRCKDIILLLKKNKNTLYNTNKNSIKRHQSDYQKATKRLN